jgi:hypothetical protein
MLVKRTLNGNYYSLNKSLFTLTGRQSSVFVLYSRIFRVLERDEG